MNTAKTMLMAAALVGMLMAVFGCQFGQIVAGDKVKLPKYSVASGQTVANFNSGWKFAKGGYPVLSTARVAGAYPAGQPKL